MTLTSDILTIIRERCPHETGVNYRISEFVLREPNYVADASIKSLAQELAVSEPSIIRFCRDIGCMGFKDFKKRLAQSLILEEKFSKTGARDAIDSGGASGDQRFNEAASGVLRAITDVSTVDHFKRIDAAAKALVDGQSILILGVGGSSAVLANEAYNRLFRLGVRAVAHSDGYMQRMVAATLRKGDALLVISSTGQPSSLSESMEVARSLGATCVALAPRNSPVGSVADILVPIELDMAVPFQRPNPVRYAQLFVLDCIAERAALLLGKPATDALRRVASVLSPLLDLKPHQPVGD